MTAKGKGAGLLRTPENLDRLLDAVCEKSPLPVSVKTRAGFDSTAEWEKLLPVYARYPLKRLILHPRACRDGYAPGTADLSCLPPALTLFGDRLVYNGDVFSPEDAGRVREAAGREIPLMLGRGLVARPSLARELKGGTPLRKEELYLFYERLRREWTDLYDRNIAFMKLRVVMKHTVLCFEHAEKYEKRIRHAKRPEELEEAAERLFDACDVKQDPRFVPDELRREL